jgi:hypothetical protein
MPQPLVTFLTGTFFVLSNLALHPAADSRRGRNHEESSDIPVVAVAYGAVGSAGVKRRNSSGYGSDLGQLSDRKTRHSHGR